MLSVTQISDKLAIYGWARGNTASSLWPCQKQYLNLHLSIGALLTFGMVSITPAWCGEKDATSAIEAMPSDAPAPMTDIHDILPPVPVGVDMPGLWAVLIALGVVLLAALAWWLWKRHRKARSIETIVPELPPEMVARQALDGISDVRGMEGKTFYYHLSAILRRYVFGRFGVGAPEMTTEEFLPCIDRLHVDHDLARSLKGLCRAMDPVKFAGQPATEKQMETDLRFAREFVRKTTQQTEIEPEKNNEGRNSVVAVNAKNPKKQISNLK
jgi:hypothetical protein